LSDKAGGGSVLFEGEEGAVQMTRKREVGGGGGGSAAAAAAAAAASAARLQPQEATSHRQQGHPTLWPA
jgi:hypothetical protein